VGWIFSIILWSISTLILEPNFFQNVNNYIFGIWIKEIKKVNAINVYHVCPRWFLIVGCLTFIWLGKLNIPFPRGACIPSFTFQELWDESIWNISKLNGHFILPSMLYFGPPHQVLVWERGLGGVLDMNGTLPMIERSKTNSYTKIIYNSRNIHHWTKTQNVIHTWHYEPIY